MIQFSLAGLVFWMFVCAMMAGVARSFWESGPKGWEYLLCFAGLTVWLGLTLVACYLRIYLLRRWDQPRKMRSELEQLVKQHRGERKMTHKSPTSSPGPAP